MGKVAEMPQYVDWCQKCHADGYMRRCGDGQWQVACSVCDEVGPVSGAAQAVIAWNGMGDANG